VVEAVEVGQRGAHRLQAGQLLGIRQVTVAEVVDPAGRGVHRGQRPALLHGQQPDPVGEVAGLLASDLLAHVVGPEHVRA
jgi:hypothetical protein